MSVEAVKLPVAKGRSRASGPRSLLLRPELTALVSTVVVFIFFAIMAGDAGFLTFAGTKNYLQVAALIGILATPVTLLLIAGEFDLSVGTMVGTAGIAVAYPITSLGWPLWAAICLGVLAALIVGTVNGLMVVRLRIPSFLVTLGMMFILRGVTLAGTLYFAGTTQLFGMKKALAHDWLYPVFSANIYGMPVSVFWWLGLAAVAAYILANTRHGNWIYAVGGDPDAALKLGIPLPNLKVVLYVLTALSAVLAAMLNMFYADLAEVQQGLGMEFEAITAAVVGGTAISGGIGSPIGTAIGAVMFGMINQGFFYTDINDAWFYAIVGAMLLIAVVINTYTRRAALRQVRSR